MGVEDDGTVSLNMVNFIPDRIWSFRKVMCSGLKFR